MVTQAENKFQERLGEKIQEQREAMDMTRDELGKAMRLSGSTIKKWEIGEVRISIFTLLKLQNVLKYNFIQDLIKFEINLKQKDARDHV